MYLGISFRSMKLDKNDFNLKEDYLNLHNADKNNFYNKLSENTDRNV